MDSSTENLQKQKGILVHYVFVVAKFYYLSIFLEF